MAAPRKRQTTPRKRTSAPRKPQTAAAEPPATKERRSWLALEVVFAAGLGLAALATSWASFRSALVEDEMIASFNRGIKAIDQSGQAYAEAQQTLVRDQALFLEYAKAARQGDAQLTVYILETLMSPELKAGVKWWENTGPALTPFEEGSPYSLETLDRYQALEVRSEDEFDAAYAADVQTDRYDFVTVTLTSSLFFFGLAGVVRRRTIQLAFTGMGGVLLIGSVILLTVIGLV
jgi:hypothetical protein